MRHVTYPLFLRRRRAWDSVTRLQACLIFFFFAANLVVIFAPFNGIDWRQIERRAAFTAGVNAIPLCLGGRMGPVVQMLNIHRTSYLLFHHWVGRIAVLEALSHAIIVLLHRPKTGTLVTSGWVTFAGFLGSLMLSFWLPRHFLGRWFLLSHRAIALTGVGALFWHALAVSQVRLQKLLFRRLSGEVVEKLVGRNATRLDISLRYPVHIQPGSYFNIFFPGRISSYNLLYSHQAMAFWHPPDDVDPEGKSSNVSFLLSHRTANVAALSVLQTGQRILLDGPFGQRLEPHSYENVILLAKGMGIAGILPLALGLAERRQHDNRIRAELQRLTQRSQTLLREEGSADLDTRANIARERAEVAKQRVALSRKPLFRDATKKIDLFWSLESNSQMDLVADQLKSLQQLDPDNSFLVVWCGYPYPRTGEPPFQPISTFWMCLEPSPQRKAFDDLIISKIGEERKKLQGRMMVSTQKTKDFTGHGDEEFDR
ncbi:nadph oxidase [Fusarium mundagurra]|uniref:Nadph oxidase n=1 Tax=Fusarium mundagurra TaxID=1567541 RepID=A0A8H5Z8T4_9HYPO|nr:nadph oxidase [Fusarium mundagurra]